VKYVEYRDALSTLHVLPYTLISGKHQQLDSHTSDVPLVHCRINSIDSTFFSSSSPELSVASISRVLIQDFRISVVKAGGGGSKTSIHPNMTLRKLSTNAQRCNGLF
jgi:hypothetical protein